jgi:hypothetical protein
MMVQFERIFDLFFGGSVNEKCISNRLEESGVGEELKH